MNSIFIRMDYFAHNIDLTNKRGSFYCWLRGYEEFLHFLLHITRPLFTADEVDLAQSIIEKYDIYNGQYASFLERR